MMYTLPCVALCCILKLSGQILLSLEVSNADVELIQMTAMLIWVTCILSFKCINSALDIELEF